MPVVSLPAKTLDAVVGTPSAALEAPLPDRRPARRELAAFAAITGAYVAAATAIAVGEQVNVEHLAEGSALGQTALYSTALAPLLGAVGARLVTRQPLRGAGWGLRWPRPRLRSLAVAWLFAVAAILPAGVAVWLLGLGSFSARALEADTGAGTIPSLVMALTLGSLPFVPLALFEEVAWRGTVQARLMELTSPRRAVVAVGLMWTAFHLPLMLFVAGAVGDAPKGWAIACFAVSTVALSFPFAGLRISTRSIWPVTVAHAVMNGAMLMFVAPATTSANAHTDWFAGETGLLIALAHVVLALILQRTARFRLPARTS
jgi:membrane protease YdiL (CAAX protease family)